MDEDRRVLVDADLAVADGRIAALGPPGQRLPGPARQELDVRGRLLLPGLVQGHVHLCQTLFRGLAEDLPLLPWLRERIWPLEAAHTPATLAASARLGLAELIRGGVTAALDMGTVRHTEVLFQEAARAGFRLVGGKAHMDAAGAEAPGLAEDTGASLAEAEALCRSWHGAAGGLLGYAFAPRFLLACSDAVLEACGELARRHGAGLHTHASENREECAAVRARCGTGNVAALDRFGLLGPRTVLAHCVHLEPGEVEILAARGATVAHCPGANLKLASGIAPVVGLRRAGVPVALGADGAPVNNNLDPWLEMRLAALLPRLSHGPAALPAWEVLAMATRGGARALGLEDRIGSLEPGKEADLLLVDLGQVHSSPTGPDPATALVFAAGRGNVRAVWIAGRQVLDQGRLLTLDEEELLARAGEAARSLAATLP